MNIQIDESKELYIQWHLQESDLVHGIIYAGKTYQPIERQGKVVAAKIIVYAGDDEEYFSFITVEIYHYSHDPFLLVFLHQW